MGQKRNPVLLRLQYTNRHFDNCWYSKYFYKNLINKDIVVQNYLTNFLKCLRLPTGRYSIQHLLKKTQVYSFFCYSKSTREWRSNLFGLAKKRTLLKRNRYFFKNKPDFKKRRKKFTKLKWFYTQLNQHQVHKIQKRITSFQNFQLWSRLQKPRGKNCVSLPITQKIESNSGDFTPYVSFHSFPHFNTLISEVQNQQFSIEKRNQSSFEKKRKNQQNVFFENNSFTSRNTLDFKETRNVSVLKKHQQDFTKRNPRFLEPKNHSSLVFLQNLFLYKIVKSHLKMKNKKKLNAPSWSFFFQKKEYKEAFFIYQIKNVLKNGVCLFFLKKKRKESPSVSFQKKSMYSYLDTKDFKVSPVFFDNKRKGVFNTLEYKYKNYLESCLSSLSNVELELTPFKVKNDWQHATYLADEIVYFLEKRIPFRRLKNKILKQLSKISAIRGVRITCSGRVGGKSKKAQRAKTECLKYGQTSLQVFSSKIDFSMKTAFTSFGSVGVKVWICYY